LHRLLGYFATVTWTGLLAAGEQPAAFSSDIHVSLAPGVFADHDAGLGQLAGGSRLNLGSLPDAADVDALHVLPSGDVLFSLDVSATLEGAYFAPSDIIRWNGQSWSKEFDGRASGILDGVNVDAVAFSGPMLLLSIDVSAVLGSVYFTDADVIAFVSGQFSLFQQASGAGIDDAADLDALHLDEQAGVLMSFDVAGTTSDVLYNDEDMLRLANSSWSLSEDGSAADSSWIAADLDAWSSALPGGIIFKDGFE